MENIEITGESNAIILQTTYFFREISIISRVFFGKKFVFSFDRIQFEQNHLSIFQWPFHRIVCLFFLHFHLPRT